MNLLTKNVLSGRQMCMYFVNETEHCPHYAKIKMTRPNPTVPVEWPKFFCYSHLLSFTKRSLGQYLVERIEN